MNGLKTMKIETTLGAVVLVGGVAFVVGAQYGYYKTKERFYKEVADMFVEKIRHN